VLLHRTNPQVLSHLAAENNYSAAVLAPMANLTAELYAEMAGRIPASDVSDPPQRYKGFYYYEYRVPGGQFMVKARCPSGSTPCGSQHVAWHMHHGPQSGCGLRIMLWSPGGAGLAAHSLVRKAAVRRNCRGDSV